MSASIGVCATGRHFASLGRCRSGTIAARRYRGSKLDVQFDNLDGRYLFGFAAFDNAQVQHATGDEPLTLVFAK